MGKVIYTDFEEIEGIIGSLMTNPQIKRAITRTNLCSFWNSILPEKHKNKSKPYGMLPGGVMIIACQNPIVAQELSLNKIMLLKKFEPYFKTLKMKVTDFKFDPKKWSFVTESN
ncbi:MAG: DUF721 domain-containing protein [bacterium]|nr:DUF721 domain-containing protein [bacterium]